MSEKALTTKPGTITSSYAGVATVTGLSGVFIHEVLLDASAQPAALVVGFTEKHTEVLLFNEQFPVNESVYRSGHPFEISVSDAWLGRVVNGLTEPLDGFAPIPVGQTTPVFLEAPAMQHRQPVTRPLITGIKVIDATLPLGRGQRELIIGDRRLGKSTIATDIVLNQKHTDEPVYCVYVLCGQRRAKFDTLARQLIEHNALLYSTVVAGLANDSYVAQYLAPFIGCTVAEHFRNSGRDALIVYDDLSKHAKVFRDIALILGRTPGRETYPGDVFSLHATLLERAAQLSEENGGGSLTALPIVETLEGDITAFIPTNIISITDGQIYLESGLYQKNFLPAVNVGLSVSRIGSVVQPPVLKSVLGGVRLALAQHKELQKLSQLDTAVSNTARQDIYRGDLLLKILTQPKHTNVTYPEQTILFYAVESGCFDDLPELDWEKSIHLLLDLFRSHYRPLVATIQDGQFGKDEQIQIAAAIADFAAEFVVTGNKS